MTPAQVGVHYGVSGPLDDMMYQYRGAFLVVINRTTRDFAFLPRLPPGVTATYETLNEMMARIIGETHDTEFVRSNMTWLDTMG